MSLLSTIMIDYVIFHQKGFVTQDTYISYLLATNTHVHISTLYIDHIYISNHSLTIITIDRIITMQLSLSQPNEKSK